MLRLVLVILVAATLMAPTASRAMCRCEHVRAARCANPDEKHTVNVKIDFTVDADDTVEVVTQSGPYHLPVADLEGKLVLFLFLPKGAVFQGFFEELVPNSLTTGIMHGASTTFSTAAAFVPGEYELVLFMDVVPGGGVGPQRGDLASFDNTGCNPTGVSVRVAVGCEDATVTLTNRHFIIF